MNLQDKIEMGYEALFDVKLFELGGVTVTLASVILLALVTIATILFSRVLRRGIVRVFKARGLVDEGTLGVTTRLVHYAVLIIGFGIGLNLVGINLNGLFAAGALFAVGLGFAMQNIASNFISGVILLLERAIKPGDVIEVGGKMLRVKNMGIRATVARTLDEEDLIIPNSLLVESNVKNYTFRDSLYRLRTNVGVCYDSDMTLVRETLEEMAAQLKWRSQQVDPRILLKEFADSAVNFEVSVWMRDPWKVQQRRSQLNEAVWAAFKEAGIVIAFPQIDLHLDAPVVESLKSVRTAV